MKRTLVALGFAALTAQAAVAGDKPKNKPVAAKAETVAVFEDSGADFFARNAAEINARSLTNCDPALDVPELSAKRESLLALPNERQKHDSRTTMVAAAAMANNGKYAVCFDTRLKDGVDLAVAYHNRARIIAINPNAPDLELAVRLGFENVRNTWNAVNAGEKPESVLEAPVAIRLSTEPAAAPPATAPHKLPEYRQ